MANVLDIGPFLIQTEWIAAGAAFLLAYAAVFFAFCRGEKEEYSPLLSNGFLVFLLTYQGSSLLFHPRMSLRDPLAMLSFPTDWKGWLLSSVVVLGVMYYTTKKRVLSFRKILRISAAFYTLSFFVFGFLLRFTGLEFSPGQLWYMLIHLAAFWGVVMPGVRLYILYIIGVVFSLAAGMLHEIYTIRTFFVYLPSWSFYITAAACITGIAVTLFTKEADHSYGS